MTDENVDNRCNEFGDPATVPANRPRKCMTCHLVDTTYAWLTPRVGRGNIKDTEIRRWARSILKNAFTEVVSLMHADLDALAAKWNPPLDDSTQEENRQRTHGE